MKQALSGLELIKSKIEYNPRAKERVRESLSLVSELFTNE